MSDEDLKRLCVCESEVQAQYVREILKENDFNVMIRGLDGGGDVFGGAVDIPEIEIYVDASDFEDAKALLQSLAEEEGEPVPAWVCKCGEEVDEGFEICWSCGAIYEDGEQTSEQGETEASEDE